MIFIGFDLKKVGFCGRKWEEGRGKRRGEEGKEGRRRWSQGVGFGNLVEL